MTKISALILVAVIYVIVSVTYTHFYNADLDFNPVNSQPSISENDTITQSTTSDLGGSVSITRVAYNPISFFIDMFAFSVPDMPYFFSIIWWILLFIFVVVIILIIRGN